MRIQPALELNPTQPNSPAKVDKVARQLEGQFAQMLVKSMRDASFGDSLLPGENTMFRDMYDQKIADAMTKGRGLGLSAMIARRPARWRRSGPRQAGRYPPGSQRGAARLSAECTVSCADGAAGRCILRTHCG